jgi:GlcNAc-PI de-N-acetylase
MKLLNTLSITLWLALAANSTASAANEINFYIVAHPDDWQLFMNPTAYNSLQGPGKKAVFIHTTSGDAGNLTGSMGEAAPYYLAREQGALRAIRFMVNGDNGGRGPHTSSTVTINGHKLPHYAYGQSVAYFLRLPDGILGTQNTLQALFDGSNPQLSAIDNSSVYFGWHDLVDTLAAIVKFESYNASKVTFNFHELDKIINPGDHRDHLLTATAIQQVAVANPCINQNLFVGYASSGKPNNINGNDLFSDIGTWAVTTSGISDNYHASTWGDAHNKWLAKNYYRTFTGNGVCKTASNIAPLATASASSENAATGQTAAKAIDGVVDGYPGNAKNEWVSLHQGAGAYLNLSWNTPVSISHIQLFDRPNLSDQITSAQLVFDNGTKIPVGRLDNNGNIMEISFDPIVTKNLKLQIDGVRNTTSNIGLAEIRVY